MGVSQATAPHQKKKLACFIISVHVWCGFVLYSLGQRTLKQNILSLIFYNVNSICNISKNIVSVTFSRKLRCTSWSFQTGKISTKLWVYLYSGAKTSIFAPDMSNSRTVLKKKKKNIYITYRNSNRLPQTFSTGTHDWLIYFTNKHWDYFKIINH